MHEAGAVSGAIDRAVDGWKSAHAVRHLEIVIRDPTRAEAEAVRFYAAALLADHDLGGVTFRVHVQMARCELCGARSRPTPADPCCSRCGAPVPPKPGAAIVARCTETGRRMRRCA
jgi:Zn finger protein HypA/HybF involved in hydrogenase expression